VWYLTARAIFMLAISVFFCCLCAASHPSFCQKTSESLWEMEGGMFSASPLVDICNGNDLLRPRKQEKRV
jgi:hypothetical protein